MNVGYVCKTIPACFPHELLGYSRNSLKGMLLTQAIVIRMNKEEQEANAEGNRKSSGRRHKFNKNK